MSIIVLVLPFLVPLRTMRMRESEAGGEEGKTTNDDTRRRDGNEQLSTLGNDYLHRHFGCSCSSSLFSKHKHHTSSFAGASHMRIVLISNYYLLSSSSSIKASFSATGTEKDSFDYRRNGFTCGRANRAAHLPTRNRLPDYLMAAASSALW